MKTHKMFYGIRIRNHKIRFRLGLQRDLPWQLFKIQLLEHWPAWTTQKFGLMIIEIRVLKLILHFTIGIGTDPEV